MQNGELLPNSKRVYLDHNATTPPSLILRNKWVELLDLWGNPSSIHQDSRQPKTVLRETRKKISDFLNCSPLEIIFNSGASEGNSSVLRSVFQTRPQGRNEFVISQVEHPSVIKAALQLKAEGAVVHFVPVNRAGQIDLNFLNARISEKTALVSVMFANNETGTIFPIKEISEIAHKSGALMHSDCVQALGKVEFDFKSLNLDYATFSAHKFYSIKGTGFCYVRKNSPWVPLISGGGQERGRRGGTENMLGIASLGLVFDDVVNSNEKVKEMNHLRNFFEAKVCQRIENISVTAAQAPRITNTSSLVIEGVDGETLLMSLDLKNYSVSTGAACSSGNPEPSPVLLAMGLSRLEAQSSLRVSLGWSTTDKEIEDFIECLAETVKKLRNVNAESKKVENVG